MNKSGATKHRGLKIADDHDCGACSGIIQRDEGFLRMGEMIGSAMRHGGLAFRISQRARLTQLPP